MKHDQRPRETSGIGWAVGALALCCTITLIIFAGGVGAVTGILGGWLGNPYVIVIGLAIVVAAVATYIARRRRKDGDA